MNKQNGPEDFDKVCRLADELAQSIVTMKACRCHGTGVTVTIIDGKVHSEPCSCAVAASQALDKWKEIQSNLCSTDKNEG